MEVHAMHACPSHSCLWNTRKRFVAVLVLRESHVSTRPLSKFHDNLALQVVSYSYSCVCVCVCIDCRCLICVRSVLQQELFCKRRRTSTACQRGGMCWCAPVDIVQAEIVRTAEDHMVVLPPCETQLQWIYTQPLGVKKRLAAYNR